jgi:hypothetical protein
VVRPRTLRCGICEPVIDCLKEHQSVLLLAIHILSARLPAATTIRVHGVRLARPRGPRGGSRLPNFPPPGSGGAEWGRCGEGALGRSPSEGRKLSLHRRLQECGGAHTHAEERTEDVHAHTRTQYSVYRHTATRTHNNTRTDSPTLRQRYRGSSL